MWGCILLARYAEIRANNHKCILFMIRFGESFSVSSSTKTLAAKTAATSSMKEASAGKQSVAGEISCHKLSKRDLAYFSSEKFAQVLKSLEDRELASQYGKLIAIRKKKNQLSKAWELVDAIIYVDIFDAHYDGFNYSFEEVRDLFKGYRSQALRELKNATGFSALMYRELVKALEDKGEIRSFLKAINKPCVKDKNSFRVS